MRPNIGIPVICAALALSLAACSNGSGSGSTGSSGQSTTAAAQNGAAAPADQATGGAPGTGSGRGRRFGELLKSLNLTPQQTEQIKAIVADARKKSEGADRETRRANMRAAYDKIETTVLTPPQRAEFQKKLAAMRAQYQQHSPAP
ncbi:MAG TPA: Spy/CpxP family protein refolding chaperone [Candidatus Baltobacteraceae bacterium]|nr:Spy/CpxP family protein refolding chaperone [Candidatus Baltobacteraceae bacterium]